MANRDITVLASAARTATTESATQTNQHGQGIHVVIDVTAVTLTPSVVFTIQGFDSASGKWYDILSSAAIVAAGTTVLKVFRGATAAPNLAANDQLPAQWRVRAVHADADSITYSVGASLVR